MNEGSAGTLEVLMEVLYEICAGLDVHKDSVVACLRKHVRGKPSREVRTFATTTASLLALADWLTKEGCTHVAMEATGVYWKPVWNILEGQFGLVLGNARAIRNVPGRKSDVNDAMWIADLLAHGLITNSLVPDAPVRELRDLTRTRKKLVEEAARVTNRIQKVLEDANIKLGSVVSDVLGMSGRAILDAIVAGETDPKKLAGLGSTRLKASSKDLVEALRGKVTGHHRFMLGRHLKHRDFLAAEIAELEARIDEVGRPFADAVERLITVPGVSRSSAFVILAETGGDMSRFKTAQHLVSFAGVCPRLDESAGKKRSTRLRHAGTWLKAAIVGCAWGAVRTKNSYYRAQYHRLKSRRGGMKAVVAVANSMLTAIFHILARGVPHRDLGPEYLDRFDAAKTITRLRRKIEDLGYKVTIEAA